MRFTGFARFGGEFAAVGAAEPRCIGCRPDRVNYEGSALKPRSALPKLARSLSSRLLLLTIVFVMVAEVLIYVPSIARYRLTYLQERIRRPWRWKRHPEAG